MSPMIKPAIRATWLGLTLGLVASGLVPGEPLAFVSVLAALLAAVVVPWRVAVQGRRDGGAESLGFVLGIGAAAFPFTPGVGALLAIAYLSLWVLALVGWTASLGAKVGQPATTCLALLALALPYVGAVPLSLLGDEVALQVALNSPLAVLSGTCAEFDLLRSGSLYRLFPPAQAAPYSYPSAFAALAVPSVIAALGWGAGMLGRLASRRLAPAPIAVVVGVLVLVGAPAPAQAQLFPETGGGGDGTPEIGDMVARVRLGYWVPQLDGYLRVDGPTTTGDRLRFDKTLDLESIFLMPTFGLDLSWDNGGMIEIAYYEAVWKGELQARNDAHMEDAVFKKGNFFETKYIFRTIAFTEYLFIPLHEFVTLKIASTQRYYKHEVRIRSVPQGLTRQHDSLEGLIPSLGLGADVLIWQMISVYGDVQWLDFTTSIFGGEDKELDYFIREWKAGVRLELVEHAHIMLEFFSLETSVKEGRQQATRYKQDLKGGRLLVSILF